MKVLISFRQEQKATPFEATRLRKNIKGSLELAGVEYTESPAASPDIAHFISPNEETALSNVVSEGVPYVVSALYAEDDKNGKFLNVSKRGEISLPSKSKKLLSGARRILVPSEFAMYTLKSLGVSNDVEVVSPGVNLSRFDIEDEVECGTFARYFRFSKNERFVLSMGDSSDSGLIEALANTASLTPGMRYFLIDASYKENSRAIKRRQKTLPKNLLIIPLISDDLYRAAMTSATAFLLLGDYSYNDLTLLECFAAKTPVIALFRNMSDRIINTKNAYFADSYEDAASYLMDLSPKASASSIINAYEFAKERTLKKIGQRLLDIYREVIA